MNRWRVFVNGILKENPVLVLVIGLCPALAVSGSANDAFGMGIAATFVLIASNILISAVRKWTPDQIRIPIFIIIISTFVTIVDYTMHAADPVLYANLGVFVPLIVVNCIILGR
ncbi:MAG: electron transport complex subunit RsxE, partial [Nitrospirae bacterium]|nr:electron transport complex subunit RsxE [Nitrospirota bacterium]